MSPSVFTDDYYAILEISQSATSLIIAQVYKRLALVRHPDRNKSANATAEFQVLARAYETLKDATSRADYDRICHTITDKKHKPASGSSSATNNALSESAQIDQIRRRKDARTKQWSTSRKVAEAKIFELQRAVQRLENDVKNLKEIAAAEAAEEALKNSWTTWLLSPLYKRVEESEEKRELKDRARQERFVLKTHKERRLDLERAALKKEEDLLAAKARETTVADHRDDAMIAVLLDKIERKRNIERAAKERAAREEQAELQRQQQEEQVKRYREAAAEAIRQRQEQERLDREKREHAAREERDRRQRQARRQPTKDHYYAANYSEHNDGFGAASFCSHGGWWSKIQGRANCTECYEQWTYLLQCPGCQKLACPKCQSNLRPKGRPRW